MNYELFYGEGTLKAIAKLKKDNPISYKKICRILHELMEHPRTGTGHPEPLKGGGNITWSRRFRQRIIKFICVGAVLNDRFSQVEEGT